MASPSTGTHLALTIIRASEVKWNSNLPNLYVRIELGNERQTRTIEKNLLPNWNECLSFKRPAVGQGTKFSVKIRHDSSFWKKRYLGKIEVELDDLLERCANGKEVELHLNAPHGSAEAAAVLHLRMEVVDSMTGAGHNVAAAEHAIQQSGISTLAASSESRPVTAVNATIDHFEGHTDLYKSVGVLVSKLDVFVRAIDALSQIHPYANFAWQVVSALYKTVEHQFEVDKKVVELIHTMRDAFDFVEQTSSLPEKTEKLKATIIQLVKQTDECCLFIQKYARSNFTERLVMLNADATIDKFLESLRNFKTSIDSGLVTHIAFVSSRISSKVDVLYLKTQLNPDEMDAYHRPQCLPGTRTEIQRKIEEWVSSDSDQSVFWMYGVAGSGKSTISTTIAEHLRTTSRLGAHLFFERTKSDPSAVIRTLAYRLSSFNSSVARHVSLAVEQDSEVARATAAVQFQSLLHGPLTLASGSMHRPVVIVLDALDECGSEKTRRTLLESLQKGLPSLPKQFRFLITSRKELDISRTLSSLPDCIIPVELEHDSSTCKGDALRYLDHEMRIVFAKNDLHLSGDWQLKMGRLGDAAGGLFIWAATVVKLVDCTDPAGKLNELTSKSQNLSGLNQLYDSVLRGSDIPFNDEASKARFSQILGLILLGKVPLSDNTIDALLGYPDDRPSRLILSRLQSVLLYTPGAPIRFCHTSFRDYLSAPERKNDPWFIDFELEKEFIALQCFDVMRNMLRFNICNTQSSYIPNDQISDLPDRIKANIPPQLEYTCLFWSQHLLEVLLSCELLDELSEFLNRHSLYWLEVMSLLGKVNIASPALLNAMNWVSSHNADTLAFLRDMRRIITIYLPAISQSTPHIYVSALLFASRESKFIARYLRPNLPIVQVEQIGVKQRSPLLKELTGHEGPVRSVVFSPDSTRVASSSDDITIRIWDAESGQVISSFEGHKEDEEGGNYIRSIAFSPDGAGIVSASNKTIRSWDVEGGQMTSRPMEGHTDRVYSVAFSPDGMSVVSGSADKTVMVWDVESGQAIKHFEGHKSNVNCVAFSPDGKHIVSGSYDRTIRIWDVKSGQTVCAPLEGHSSDVWSVAFSRDGTCIASGSWDHTIRIWDAQTGERIYEPFEGHTKPVTSVAFSPDSKRVASGSNDMTVRIWDVESGRVVSGPFEGHTSRVLSIAFSPDGTRVVSGSYDHTIRIWDAEGVQVASGGFEGHTAEVESIAISPNGKRIVSASYDRTIRIWDAESGHTISRPFKGHLRTVESVAFSPDGRRVASGSGDHTICVWDAESGNVVSGPFKGGYSSLVRSVCFSPDGSRVAPGSNDNTVRIWDVESGKTISGPFKGHTDDVRSVAFSSDGRSVVSGSFDNTIIVWDVESGEIISGPLKGHRDCVRSVAFSSDGTRVASGAGDKTILIWDVASGQVVAGPFEGHTRGVQSAAFSPDGARVVSGSNDGTVRVWDTHSEQTVFAPFEGHTNRVISVAFSSDGRHVVSGSWDRVVRMWNVQDPVFDWTMDEDGWIRGGKGELLLWIPPDLRLTLWRPQNTAVLGRSFSTRLDFTNAALGERWQECFEPPQ